MTGWRKEHRFDGRLVMLGFGSIGQGVLPLLLRHIETAPVMAGVIWAMQHPHEGVLEPDDLPHDEMLRIIRPYLGAVVGVYSDWTPLADRGWLFEEDLDRDDPWRFRNFRVA
jgi:homospermidine synthase